MSKAIASIPGKLPTGMFIAGRSAKVISPPPSGSSSDTLHESDSFDDERRYLNVSPLSTATLNFEDLNIVDDEFVQQPTNVNLISAPQHSYAKHHHLTTPHHDHRVPQLRRNSYHHGHGSGFVRAGGAQRNQRPWMSDEARAAQEVLVVRNSMKRQFKNSEVARWKVADYIAHHGAMVAYAAKKQAQSEGHESVLRVPPISPSTQDMMRRCGLRGNFDQVGNFGRALGEKTIWCEDWQNGKDEIAPWPCLAELKWEGDDRAKTGVGRFPPLPREQGPVGLPWNQLQALEQYPIDQIARIPTMEDIYLPVDEIDDEVKYDLLNKDLEDTIHAYLES